MQLTKYIFTIINEFGCSGPLRDSVENKLASLLVLLAKALNGILHLGVVDR